MKQLSPSFAWHGLIICCLSFMSPAIAAKDEPPPLGRLFFTPDMRAKLESQRKFDIKEIRSLEDDHMRLDGIVMRSSGKSTVWVNKQPQHETDIATGVSTRISRQHPERATLIAGEDTPVDLKVGVSINRATRETQGGLDAGEIRVNRATTNKPQ